MSVFNFFQTFGYYGFAAWVPTLLIAKGIKVTTSLEYSFIIAIANPVGPLLCTRSPTGSSANGRYASVRSGSACSACCSPTRTVPALLILLGVLMTLCNNLLSYGFHSYQSELFPTRFARARSALSIPGAGCRRRCRASSSRFCSIWAGSTRSSPSSLSRWPSS